MIVMTHIMNPSNKIYFLFILISIFIVMNMILLVLAFH